MNYTSTFLITIITSLFFFSCAKEQPRGMVLDWIEVTQLPSSVASSSFNDNYFYPTLDEGEIALAESIVFQRSIVGTPTRFDRFTSFTGKKYLDFNTKYTLAVFHQYSSPILHYFEHDFVAHIELTPASFFDGESTVEFEKDSLQLTVGVRWIY